MASYPGCWRAGDLPQRARGVLPGTWRWHRRSRSLRLLCEGRRRTQADKDVLLFRVAQTLKVQSTRRCCAAITARCASYPRTAEAVARSRRACARRIAPPRQCEHADARRASRSPARRRAGLDAATDESRSADAKRIPFKTVEQKLSRWWLLARPLPPTAWSTPPAWSRSRRRAPAGRPQIR